MSAARVKYFEKPFDTEPFQDGFTDPFRYVPDRAVREAARQVTAEINGSEGLSGKFAEDKILGVKVMRDAQGCLGYLAGFSGNVGGRSSIDGFVPPVFDLAEPDGYYKIKEREISDTVKALKEAETSAELRAVEEEITALKSETETVIAAKRAEMAASRAEREKVRSEALDDAVLDSLVKQSQREKSAFRRMKREYASRMEELLAREKSCAERISVLRQKHRMLSDELQKWIFGQYIVHNSLGEESSVLEIFRNAGLTPPGGTGECAAPKLLEYAFRNNLTPLSMGEFWYGSSPDAPVRTHGHFYPSCTSRCGPLLGFMLKGMKLKEPQSGQNEAGGGRKNPVPEILYSDDRIIVASNPSGMPSLPVLDGRKSLQEHLSEHFGRPVLAVHRLDMDTSGIMVFTFDEAARESLQRQFENRTVSKTYRAILCPGTVAERNLAMHLRKDGSLYEKEGMAAGGQFANGTKGTISLPLSPDYDERPRQKVDFNNGKEAVTEYEFIKDYPDGTSEVIFRPQTGRTHQLRVHSAHILGLGRPMAGDLLYGGFLEGVHRLMLHAECLEFDHPWEFDCPVEFDCPGESGHTGIGRRMSFTCKPVDWYRNIVHKNI